MPMRALPGVLVLLMLAASAPVIAEDMTAGQPPSRLVRVGVFPLNPLTFIDDQGVAAGIFPDLVRDVGQSHGWETVFVEASWALCLQKLHDGELDLMSPIARTDERAERLDFSTEPVLSIWGQVFIRPGTPVVGIEDLQGGRVGLMKRGINGVNFLDMAERFGVSCEITEYGTHEEIFKAIAEGTLEAGVAPHYYGLLHASEYGLAGTSIQFSPFPVFFATRKGENPDLLRILDQELAVWKSDVDSYYHQRLAHWMGAPTIQEFHVPAWLYYTVVAAAGLAILLVLLNRILKQRVRKAIRELKDSEHNYRELVESASIIIVRWDLGGGLRFINRFGLRLLGLEPGEPIHSELRDCLWGGGKGDSPAETARRAMKMPGRTLFTECLLSGDKGQALTIQWSHRAILDDEGGLREMLSVGMNVTQRKHLEERLIQAQKSEALGTLAGGIAHDFNNILAVIGGYSELGLKQPGLDPDVKDHLEQIRSAVHRARELTQQILSYSRKADLKHSEVHLPGLVKEALKMLRSALPSTIDIRQDIRGNGIVNANATQLHQVMMNLCTNAFHAMEDGGGTLEVTLREVVMDGAALRRFGEELQPGSYQVLSVRDTGTGMSLDVQERLFDPYFTTKDKGKGTGLGMAVVQGILLDHGGGIHVESSPGEGSTVQFCLPSFKESVSGHLKADVQDAPRGKGEHVLVVDDEPQIIHLFQTTLQMWGYRVTTFTGPEQALEAVRERRQEFDLVLTDLSMPGMNGLQLSRAIHDLRPDLPVLLCTGNSENIGSGSAAAARLAGLLEKPVGALALLAEVHRALSEPIRE